MNMMKRPQGRNIRPAGPALTPQGKLIGIGQKLGVDLDDQQGSTRVLWDSLPLDGQQTLNFFENPAAAINTLGSTIGSNVDGQNGLLSIGEGLVIEYISFQVVVFDPVTKTVTAFDTVQAAGPVGFKTGFFAGTTAILIENQQVLKPMSNAVFNPSFNATPLGTAAPSIFRFMTNLTIVELLKFKVQVAVPPYTAAANTFLRCTIQGRGAVYSAQTTY
jgi:hypothetical protein